MRDIPLFELNYCNRETEAVRRVLDDGWLTMGERTTEFERKFSIFLGDGVECAAVSSGTAALHLALLALGVSDGCEVVVPATAFVADVNVVRLVGASPVLADSSSLDNWNVSADSIDRKLTPRTKAVIVIHFAGYPCDIRPIVELCKEKNVFLIEDVAHAPGASVAGKACGTWGDVGCFSFFSNKNLSIGEGGMVATSDEKIFQALRHLRSHGMSRSTLDRQKGRVASYDVTLPGLNYRMDEIRAALGLVQLEKLGQANIRRAELSARYRTNLKNSGIHVPAFELAITSLPVHHIFPVLLPDKVNRQEVTDFLSRRGIQTTVHYPPLWEFECYKGWFDADEFPIASEIARRTLTLPLFPTLANDEVDRITDTLIKAIG